MMMMKAARLVWAGASGGGGGGGFFTYFYSFLFCNTSSSISLDLYLNKAQRPTMRLQDMEVNELTDLYAHDFHSFFRHRGPTDDEQTD